MLNIKPSDFAYQVPAEKIALYPLAKRDDSKLLIYRDGKIEESIFKNIANYLTQPCLFVRNNTRVIQARMIFENAQQSRIEIFLLEPCNEPIEKALQNHYGKIRFNCLIGNKRKWKGEGLIIETEIKNQPVTLCADYIGEEEANFIVEFKWNNTDFSFSDLIEVVGHTPLPPYIKRNDEIADKLRYQTVYAATEGSVAAPTAGLHFTEKTINQLKSQQHQFTDVTLHVGAGTFKPVTVENIADHEMHAEEIHVTVDCIKEILAAIEEKKIIVAVGTTSLRTIETLYGWGVQLLKSPSLTLPEGKGTASEKKFFLAQWWIYNNNDLDVFDALNALLKYASENNLQSIRGKTQMIIAPEFKFKVADAIITNFHQPGSTLMMLVAAFIGDDWKAVYDYALENDFRFLSYGDGSLLFKRK